MSIINGTNINSKRGITLVALIITIIIMLILAGVAISLITGEGSIFNKADLAKTKYEQAAQNEKNTIDQLMVSDIIIPDSSKIQFTYTPSTGWTNQPVKVDITTSETGYALQYSLDNGTTWENYEGSLSITKNNTDVLARMEKDGVTGEAITGTVSNIDTAVPVTSNIVAGAPTTTSCALTFQGADNTATADNGASGISKYELYVDGVLNRTINSTNSTENVTLSLTNSSYSCYVRAYDNAGNYKQSSTITVTKHVHTDACYAYTTVEGVWRVTAEYYQEQYDEWLIYYRCSACGATTNSNYDRSADEGVHHCTQSVRTGQLICGK